MRVPILLFLAATALTAPTAAAQPAARKPAVDSAALTRDDLVGLSTVGDPSFDESSGALVVTKVDPAGPWHLLGLRAGDTVLAVDGDAVVTAHAFSASALNLRLKHVGYIEILRKKKALLLRRTITGPLPSPSPASAADPTIDADLDRWVVAKGTNTWAIDVDALLADPMRFSKGARVMPASTNGVPDGFKLYAVRPSSVYARMGFANGDTIHRINGMELTTPDEALEVYAKLRDANTFSVDVTRRGKPLTLKYIRMKATP